MLRISSLEENGVTTLVLQGKFLVPWVEELEVLLPADAARTRLNLIDLRFVDRASAAYLRGLQRRGVLFIGASPLVAELIRDENAGH